MGKGNVFRTPLYIIELPFKGNPVIRQLTEVESAALFSNDLTAFDFWRLDADQGRFWINPGTGLCERGFEAADSLVGQFDAFVWLDLQYSWGSNGGMCYSPAIDLFSLLPSAFVNLIAGKGLLALSVTASVQSFLNGYLHYANALGGEEIEAEARKLGLLGDA
jgi:hypothetical protein